MIERLLTEQRNPASEGIDAKPTAEMLRIINDEDRRVAEAVTPEIPRIAEAVEGIVDRLGKGGRLFYIGAGTSGRLGVLDASECRPTFNVPDGTVQGHHRRRRIGTGACHRSERGRSGFGCA
jgi:N-acetylmuramic acid 6-phosphate etherase